jgi:hypothetical protein
VVIFYWPGPRAVAEGHRIYTELTYLHTEFTCLGCVIFKLGSRAMQHPCSVEYWSAGAYYRILHDYGQALVVDSTTGGGRLLDLTENLCHCEVSLDEYWSTGTYSKIPRDYSQTLLLWTAGRTEMVEKLRGRGLLRLRASPHHLEGWVM